VGVGPGDPGLVTVRGAKLIGQCPHLFVPKARSKAESVALNIVREYVSDTTRVHELVFPMVKDEKTLKEKWDASARAIAGALKGGEDAVFVTLGDPLLYSTYIYLLRALRERLPEMKVETVPGVNALSAVAALTNFPVGIGDETVTIVPTSEDMESVRRAIDAGGTVILMKVGKKLPAVLDLRTLDLDELLCLLDPLILGKLLGLIEFDILTPLGRLEVLELVAVVSRKSTHRRKPTVLGNLLAVLILLFETVVHEEDLLEVNGLLVRLQSTAHLGSLLFGKPFIRTVTVNLSGMPAPENVTSLIVLTGQTILWDGQVTVRPEPRALPSIGVRILHTLENFGGLRLVVELSHRKNLRSV